VLNVIEGCIIGLSEFRRSFKPIKSIYEAYAVDTKKLIVNKSPIYNIPLSEKRNKVTAALKPYFNSTLFNSKNFF
jgi:hypothetical protein